MTVCSVGFLPCLAQLLRSPPDDASPLDGVALVRRKVARAVVMGGSFGKPDEPDYNFASDPASAAAFFRLWPAEVDVVVSPCEVGDGIRYPTEAVVSDIDWTDRHPIKQVYLNRSCETGQKMWDPLASIAAVEGDDAFALSERGTVEMTEAGTVFRPAPDGNCRYQLPGDAAWNAAMLERIRALVRMH